MNTLSVAFGVTHIALLATASRPAILLITAADRKGLFASSFPRTILTVRWLLIQSAKDTMLAVDVGHF